jgi:8-oxo-dGTP pyrophosphatase MutT (NUDIX family)
MSAAPRATLGERLTLWLWRHVPVSGSTKLIVAWLANVRYAVGVAAIIPDGDGRVFVAKHTYRGRGHEWGLPGGWVKGRERLEAALARELREETGLEIVVGRLVSVQSGYALPRLTVYFLARISGGTFRPSAEVSDYEYRLPGELTGLLGAERHAIEHALASAGTT